MGAESAPQVSAPSSLVVEEGQTLWQIASKYGVSVNALIVANELRPSQVLRVGQRIVIPSFSQSQSPVQDGSATVPSARPKPGAHVVGQGETLWAIAQQYGISVESLANANNLTEDSLIYPGKKLTVPAKGTLGPGTEVTSTPKNAPALRKAPVATSSKAVIVHAGQTLSSIARANQVSVSALMAANNLSSPHLLRIGQRVIIPGANAVIPRLRQGTVATPEPAPPDYRVAAGELVWPARGSMTSGFGWRRTRNHNGIDISANRGAPITAAMAGKVILTGWYGGYGLAVVLDHGDGVQTIYGHASKILVHLGEEVDAGATIALVGCTGVCTGPHLHFEVRLDGRPVNPLQYLP